MSNGIGRKIKALRLKAGYQSLGELNRVSGVPVSTLSRIEADIQRPKPETLDRLAPYLGVSYNELMRAAGYLNNTNKVSKQDKNSDLEEQWPEGIKVLRRAQEKLTPERRKTMLRLIEAYIREEEENEAKKGKK